MRKYMKSLVVTIKNNFYFKFQNEKDVRISNSVPTL